MRKLTHSKYSSNDRLLIVNIREKKLQSREITDCSFFQHTILFSAYDLNDVVDEMCDVIYQVINILNEYDLTFEIDDKFNNYEWRENNKKEICTVLVGQIADAVLRREEYKHTNNRIIEEESLILKKCTYILMCVFDDIEKYNINIEEAFEKMLNEARSYIINNTLDKDGFYSENIKKEIYL